VIGVQSQGNLPFFQHRLSSRSADLEILHNWLTPAPATQCDIDIGETPLAGRTIFVYAGNMGVAQAMDILLDLAEILLDDDRIGFLFVGRGTEVDRLRGEGLRRGLDNILFFDEIEPDKIPALYAQCDFGLVALDPRHKTHNIPGKFISYVHSGLPVLACVNAGNDLVEMIEENSVGKIATDNSAITLSHMVLSLLDATTDRHKMVKNCKSLARRMFSSERAADQIVSALANTKSL
jgi:glycosyltransferase involved in cell wall biosynthesis